MVQFSIATDSTETSERFVAYLAGRVTAEDSVTAVNSLHGGDRTDQQDVSAGQAAIDVVADRLDCTVETRQFVRGNDPVDDILRTAREAAVDEIVIGIRDRNPTGKVVFGSTAQDVLLESDRPVVAVPG